MLGTAFELGRLSENWRLATSETGLEASLREVGTSARLQLAATERAEREAARAASGAVDFPGIQGMTVAQRRATYRQLIGSWSPAE